MSGARFCVFCGSKPVAKTNEHVVPRWLIELTGDPKRPIHLAPFFAKEHLGAEIAFDQLVFPACDDCNSRFSDLETDASEIVVRMLAFQPLSAFDLSVLLDWLDKVRVGLWLGWHQYLTTNPWNIQPHFHIQSRVGASDRMLLIYRGDRDQRGLAFLGVSMPAFAHMPSCFGLRINSLYLLSAANQFLLSEAFGLPYLDRLAMGQTTVPNLPVEAVVGVPNDGTGVIRPSAIHLPYDRNCTAIGQPALSAQGAVVYDGEGQELGPYRPTYADDLRLSEDRAFPFLIADDQAVACPVEPSRQWIPRFRHRLPAFVYHFGVQVLRAQNYLIDRVEVSEALPRVQYDYSHCIGANRMGIRTLTEVRLSLDGRDLDATPRNAACPCGSGMKYKHCCGDRRSMARRIHA